MAANLGSVPAPLPATANLVGNTFVSKYYNVLHQSPHFVHRFYTDRSILSRAEAGANGAVDIVITQAGINQKIMSLDYIDFRAEIKTVDSLESLNGSVLVMVTGSLSSQGRPKRNFVQTFFLAPQEVGYFVLNDMFRYLDGEQKPAQHHVVMPNGTVEQHVPLPDQGVGDVQCSPKQETSEFNVCPSQKVQHDEQQKQASEEEEIPPAETVVEDVEDSSPPEEVNSDAPAEEQGISSNEEVNAEEAPKKSYASIVRVRSDTSGSPASAVATGLKSSPSKNDRHATSNLAVQQAHASVTQSTMSDVMTSSTEGPEEGTAKELEGDGRSVYIKNLPLSITHAQLEEEFTKFGSIKPGGATLRNQRAGVCFAFIEYEEASSAQSAIEASPIFIGGRQVYVEEKKPMPVAQRSLRGRFNQGRGYQHDGLRGRGYFAGRGFDRGSGLDYERDGGRGGGAGRGNYSGGNMSFTSNYGSNFNTVNGYRRTDSQQGWSGSRPMRRGAGNQGGRGRGQGQE